MGPGEKEAKMSKGYDRQAHYKALYDEHIAMGMLPQNAAAAAEANALSPEEIAKILDEEHEIIMGIARRAYLIGEVP